MTRASSLPYRLRPNKSVDRELFLSLLTRLSAGLDFARYKYIGLGGPFMEDFRLIHARLGIREMECVEREEGVHRRQLFNKPIASMRCVLAELDEHLAASEFEAPVILWLDYTAPGLRAKIDTFANRVLEVPLGSVLRITLNASPEPLGRPGPDDQTDLHEFRLARFKDLVGEHCPAGIGAADMPQKRYGRTVLRALKLAVERRALEVRDRQLSWALATAYADGQNMATATLVITPAGGDAAVERALGGWEFRSAPESPLVLDMPALSSLERLIMEASADPGAQITYLLPRSDLGTDPIESFKRFYRFFPHISRVEL